MKTEKHLIECPDCKGGMLINNFYSNCCGASGFESQHNPVCRDCGNTCSFITEPCETCGGLGEIEDNQYEEAMDLKYMERSGK